MRRAIAFAAATIALASMGAIAACSVDLGEAPALCSSGKCPEGYDCIHGVCAKPGTAVPATLTSLDYLRDTDLRLVATSHDVIALWEVYHYDTELFDFAASRIGSDGNPSDPVTVVSQYPASSNYLEPFFDVYGTTDDDLLFAIGAAPPPDDAYTDSRLSMFDVHIPGSGTLASQSVWELRMPSIGYGAVSQPHFVKSDRGIELAYFQSLTAADPTDMTKKDTLGQLAIFDLTADGDHGAAGGADCLARTCFTTRKPATNLPVAVSVIDAITTSGNVYWVVDDTRPSFAREIVTADPPVLSDGTLPNLAIPVDATDQALLFIAPSARTGDKLADAPVSGPAILDQTTIAGKQSTLLTLPGTRDVPRPVYLRRDGKPALLISAGTDVNSASLHVTAVDATNNTTKEVATIPRFSNQAIGAIRAAIVGAKLYVVWLDVSDATAVVRASVIDEP